ncbi:MAG: hypothetical protein M1827_007699 [Pycnora praestabilis]|nr:MAG: hypothetical protein M1827_007699 [Pycnora praestabilis]
MATYEGNEKIYPLFPVSVSLSLHSLLHSQARQLITPLIPPTVEHSIPPPATTTPSSTSTSSNTNTHQHPPYPPRRPDLSTFFSTLELVDTSSNEQRTHNNAHAIPTPGDVSAAFRTLADAFEVMRNDGNRAGGVGEGQRGEGEGGNELLEQLVATLMEGAERPPREVRGVSQEFLDGLERIPKKSLKPTDTCPICNNPFLEDAYPLVIRLPCHPSHTFDLECIQPWLKLQPTCPLDRVDLLERRKEGLAKVVEGGKKEDEEEEEEEIWDEMYA